jgi:hypothetical protein
MVLYSGKRSTRICPRISTTFFCPPLIRIQENEAKRQALKLEAQKRVPEDESD